MSQQHSSDDQRIATSNRIRGRSRRAAVVSVISIVLVMSGCTFADILEWSGAPVPDTTEDGTVTASATPSQVRATPVATNTPWAYSTPTSTPIATSTPWRYASPTPSPTPRATATPTPTPTPTPTSTPSPTPVVSLLPALPTLEEVPSGLSVDREVAFLDVEEIARESEDPELYRRLLDQWDYRRGAAREFVYPNPGLVEFLTRMLGLDARVMEFGSDTFANAAIEFQRESALQRPDWRLRDAEVERIGDATIALRGTADYEGMEVRVTAIFVRKDNTVYRFVGVSGAYDAFDETVGIARRVVERN